jgi:hypothetical protein
MRYLLLMGLLVSALPREALADAFTESLTLETRAYELPRGAPTLVAHAGASFDPSRPFDVVLFLHGWNGCVNVLVRAGEVPCIPGGPRETGWDLAGGFDAAGTNALFLAPQLAYRTREGRPGRLAQEGAAARMIDEAFTALGPRTGGKRLRDVRRVIVVAHSAGFMAALAVMRRGGLGEKLTRVVLMDALYDVPGAFFTWLRGGAHRHIVSIHTADRRTTMHNAALAELGRRTMPGEVSVDPSDLRAAAGGKRLVILRSSSGHSAVPRRYLVDVLGP